MFIGPESRWVSGQRAACLAGYHEPGGGLMRGFVGVPDGYECRHCGMMIGLDGAELHKGAWISAAPRQPERENLRRPTPS